MFFLLVLGRRGSLGQDDEELSVLCVQLGLDGAGVEAPGDREHLEEACPLAAVDPALAGDLQLGHAVGPALAGDLQLPPGVVHDLQLLLPEP